MEMTDDYEQLCDILSKAIPKQVRRTIIVSQKEHERLANEIRYLDSLIDLRDKVCSIARTCSLLKETKHKD